MNAKDSAGMLFPLLLLLAAALRLLSLGAEYQYDELWTLMNFVPLPPGRILFDLALPNNHPVNTLVLKLLSLGGTSPWLIRSGSFAAGLAVVALCGFCAYRLRGNSPHAGIAAMLFAAFSAPLILYSATARGYIWQCFGLLLCGAGLLECGQSKRKKLTEYWPEAAIVAGGVLAFLSVPTGVLFLLPLGAAFLLFSPPERKSSRAAWTAAGILAAAGLIYYLICFAALRSGQAWGRNVAGFRSFAVFLYRTLGTLLPLPLLLWMLIALWFAKRARAALLLTLFPLAAALVTKGGPERAYLPLHLSFILPAACGFDFAVQHWPRGRRIAAALLLLCAAGSFALGSIRWKPESPTEAWRNAMENSGADELPVLPSTSGFPASVNDPRIPEEFQRRASAPELSALLMLDAPAGVINGADRSFAEKELTIAAPGEVLASGLAGRRYRLVRCFDRPRKGDAILLIVRGSSALRREAEEFLTRSGECVALNVFFSRGTGVFAGRFDRDAETDLSPLWECYRIGGRP